MSDPVGPTSMELDAMETPPEGPKMEDIRLDGDSVPEELRGKSVADVVKQFGSMAEAIRISEQARLQAETLARTAAGALERGTPPAPTPTPEPDLTPQELADLHDRDPLAAITYMTERATKQAERNLQSRMGSLMESTGRQVESAMRAKYPLEFQLFGEEITRLAGSVPNKEQVLTNTLAWEEMIALVRGRDANLQRFIDAKTGKTPEQLREIARAQQVNDAGISMTSATGGYRVPTSVNQLDATQREIAQKLGMSEAEYVKWSNIGTVRF